MSTDSEITENFELFIEDLPYDLPATEKVVPDCANSVFSVVMEGDSEEIPDFINVLNEESDGRVSITLEATENLGLLFQQNNDITFALKVLETDTNTNFVALKIYNVHITNDESLSEEILDEDEDQNGLD